MRFSNPLTRNPKWLRLDLALNILHGGERLSVVCAFRPVSRIPFRETFARPEMFWKQFRRRMDTEQPYCIVPGHFEEEVRRSLITFEELYRSQLLDLNLHRWTKSIFTWLTNPILDPDATGRVTMDHLTRLVTRSLRCAYEQGTTDVDAITLQAVAKEARARSK